MQNEYTRIFEYVIPYTTRTEFTPLEQELKRYRETNEHFFEDESKFLFISHIEEEVRHFELENSLYHIKGVFESFPKTDSEKTIHHWSKSGALKEDIIAI